MGCINVRESTLNDEKNRPILYCDGRYRYAHVAYWLRNKGYVPSGHVVVQTCKNNRCINLNHLKLIKRKKSKARGNLKSVKKNSK